MNQTLLKSLYSSLLTIKEERQQKSRESKNKAPVKYRDNDIIDTFPKRVSQTECSMLHMIMIHAQVQEATIWVMLLFNLSNISHASKSDFHEEDRVPGTKEG